MWNSSVPRRLKIIPLLTSLNIDSLWWIISVGPGFSFARSWIELVKEQPLQGTTASCTNISLHFWYFPFRFSFCSFKLILPNNEGNRYNLLKVIHVLNVNLNAMWKGKHNQQSCYWRRASQIKQFKARDAFRAVRDVRFHIVFFFCRRGREGERTQPPTIYLQFFGKPIQIVLTFEKRFNRQQFSFISLKLRLTEQFKVFILSMIEKT